MRTIEVKQTNLNNKAWYAKADFTNDKWIMTPFYGPATFEKVAFELLIRNPGYKIMEV